MLELTKEQMEAIQKLFQRRLKKVYRNLIKN